MATSVKFHLRDDLPRKGLIYFEQASDEDGIPRVCDRVATAQDTVDHLPEWVDFLRGQGLDSFFAAALVPPAPVEEPKIEDSPVIDEAKVEDEPVGA